MGLWSSIRAFVGGFTARAWDAAMTNRLNQAQWAHANGQNLNDKIDFNLETLRNRSIDEAERNPFIEGMIETYVASVVGIEGPSLQIQSDDEKFNDWAEKAWWRWWQSCDLNGQLSGVDMLRQWVRSLFTCGEFLVLETKDGESDWVQYRIQDIHPKRLKSLSTVNSSIRNGIELDDFGKPIAYFIETFLASESRAFTGREDRYLARDIMHGFRQREPGQVRGIPWLAAILQTAADIRCYDEQVMDAARAAADNAVLLQTNHPDAKYMAVNESTSVERRTIRTLPPGWSAVQMNAAQPAAQYTDYRSERLREIGRPVNMPLMMVRLDSSNHNYSSARFDGQMYSRGVAVTQRWIDRIVMNRMADKVIREAALIDGMEVPEHEKRWTWETMPHVDPAKEASADEMGLNNNTTTLADVCAKNGGKDWEQVLKQRAREKDMEKELGLKQEPVEQPDEPVPGNPGQPLTPAQQRWIGEFIEARLEESGVRV